MDLPQAIGDAVERRRAPLVALVRELVSYRSENPKLLPDPGQQELARLQEAACQDCIAEHLRGLGMAIDRFEALPGRDDVVGILSGASDGPSLILNGHVDVVPAGDPALWPCDPWSGEVSGGKIWGRGACDMKGGLAAAIGALSALGDVGVRLAGDVVVQAVVDEESGGPGTRVAVKRHRADAAIVLEPTAGSIMPVEGGLEWLRVVVAGRSGHSALRYRSVHAGGRGVAVNAIEKAVKVLNGVQELERYWGNVKVHPLLPKGITTINPGLIEGGSPALSTMADRCILGLSLKYLPGEQLDEVKREFEDHIRAVAQTDAWLREHPPTVEWGVSGVSFPPSEISTNHPLATVVANAYRSIRGEPTWAGFEAVSDLAWLAEAGVPALLLGPGDPAQAHTSAEYVEIDDLVATTSIVALAIAGWCGVT